MADPQVFTVEEAQDRMEELIERVRQGEDFSIGDGRVGMVRMLPYGTVKPGDPCAGHG